MSNPVTLSKMKSGFLAVANLCPSAKDSSYVNVGPAPNSCLRRFRCGGSDGPHVLSTESNAKIWLLQLLPAPTTSLNLVPSLPWQTIWPWKGVVVGVVVALVVVGVVVVSTQVPHRTGHSSRSCCPTGPAWSQSKSSDSGHASGSSTSLHCPGVVVLVSVVVDVVVVVVHVSHRAVHMMLREPPKMGCAQSLRLNLSHSGPSGMSRTAS